MPRATLFFVTADWCSHCRQLKAEKIIPEVRRKLRGADIDVVNLNDTKHAPMVKELGVTGFPSIIFVGANGKRYEYTGNRIPASIIQWVCVKSGSCSFPY